MPLARQEIAFHTKRAVLIESGVAEVVSAENTPVRARRKSGELALPNIIHVNAISVKIRPGVGPVDVNVFQKDVGAVGNVDGRIRIHVFGGGRFDFYIADLQVVDACDVETVGLESGGGVARDGQIGNGFQLIVGGVEFGLQQGGVSGVGGDGVVEGTPILD